MYIEGIVIAIDNINVKVKLKVEELDNFITPWLVVPQLWTVNNKARYMPELNTLMSAILNDDLSCGAILGSIYNDIDKIVEDKNEYDFIQFSDGVSISHKENSNVLELSAKTIKINGNIDCSGDIKDKTSTIQFIREQYNSHTHTNGNNGSNTGEPTSKL